MYGVAVVVVGSIFRLHYEAILKENARVMKKTNSDREEKNDNDEREPFFLLRSALQPSRFGTGDFLYFIFFYTHRNPFSCSWGRGKRKKNQYRRNPIVSSGEEPVRLWQQQSLYSFLFSFFFFFIHKTLYIYIRLFATRRKQTKKTRRLTPPRVRFNCTLHRAPRPVSGV